MGGSRGAVTARGGAVPQAVVKGWERSRGLVGRYICSYTY